MPLTLWFIVSAVSLSGAGYEEVRAWLAGAVQHHAMLLLIVAVFWHAQLGVQVIIEDYVHHEATKLASLMAVNFAADRAWASPAPSRSSRFPSGAER